MRDFIQTRFAEFSDPLSNNNLRDESGGLIGGLVVFDYVDGIKDFEVGKAPPEITTHSYDLGRQRAAQHASDKAAIQRWLKAADDRREKAMRELLNDEQFAEYRKNMDAIAKPESNSVTE